MSIKSSKNSLPPGMVLQTGSHSFRIDRVISAGGFGVTYLATTLRAFRALGHEVKKGEMVVVKECFRDECMKRLEDGSVALTKKIGETMRRNFISEAQLIHRCQGQFPPTERGSLRTGLVPVYHAGQMGSMEAEGIFYYVVPYIDGGTLEDYVGRLTVADAVLLLFRLLNALRRLHAMRDEKGDSIVHGDIKPQNIMLTRDRYPVLIDFGGAVARVKTPAYASPEQSRAGSKITPAADLFSLAVTFHYILKGKLPPGVDRRIMTGGGDLFDVQEGLLLNEDPQLLKAFHAFGHQVGLNRFDARWAEHFLYSIDVTMSMEVESRLTLEQWCNVIVPQGSEKMLSRLRGGVIATFSGSTGGGLPASVGRDAGESILISQLWEGGAPPRIR